MIKKNSCYFFEIFWIFLIKKIFFGEKNNRELSTFGFGEKQLGLMSDIFLISNLQFANIDNLP